MQKTPSLLKTFFLLTFALISAAASLQASPTLASIIKIPPASKDVSYKDLICTETDKAMITEIITALGENGKLSLLMKRDHLKELGARISHIHPLKFLAVIFSHPQLKSYMLIVFDDYFKRTNFMDDLGPALSREAEKGKLDLYWKDFAHEVRIPPANIRPFFDNRDWENLVRYLMHYDN
jgi:hypothetical protein